MSGDHAVASTVFVERPARVVDRGPIDLDDDAGIRPVEVDAIRADQRWARLGETCASTELEEPKLVATVEFVIDRPVRSEHAVEAVSPPPPGHSAERRLDRREIEEAAHLCL